MKELCVSEVDMVSGANLTNYSKAVAGVCLVVGVGLGFSQGYKAGEPDGSLMAIFSGITSALAFGISGAILGFISAEIGHFQMFGCRRFYL